MADALIDLEPPSNASVSDWTPVVRDALDACRGAHRARLTFRPGTYHFWPHDAVELFRYISNNDSGIKRVAFAIRGQTNLCIDGTGARFVFHGRMIPFLVDGAANVTLQQFAVDVDRPFFTQGTVVDARPGSVDLHIDPNHFPYQVRDDRLILSSETWETDYVDNMLEFDARRGAPLLGCRDSFLRRDPPRARLLDRATVRLTGHYSKQAEAGSVMVIKHEQRHHPTIVISESADIAVRDVTVHQSGTMGLVAQLSTDIQIERFRVLPTPSTPRLVSTNTDATHFVNCRGSILLDGCHFEGQLDDAVNIHGSYLRVTRVTSAREFIARVGHHQQAGVVPIRPGDSVALVDGGSLLDRDAGVAAGVTRLDARHVRVELADRVPGGVRPGDGVQNLDANPDVVIRRCHASKNRARGLLVSTRGRVLVEENTILAEGTAIRIGADMATWYEAGPVRNVLIRDNTLETVNAAGVFGHALIDIDIDIDSAVSGASAFHSGIRITGNILRTTYKDILHARSVDGLRLEGNQIQALGASAPQILTADCSDASIRDNAVTPEGTGLSNERLAP